MLKTIEQGGEGGGVLFFILCKKIFDEVSFYFIKDFFAPQRAVFYFFITFLSDAGGHLDLGIKVLIWNGLTDGYTVILQVGTKLFHSNHQTVAL